MIENPPARDEIDDLARSHDGVPYACPHRTRGVCRMCDVPHLVIGDRDRAYRFQSAHDLVRFSRDWYDTVRVSS